MPQVVITGSSKGLGLALAEHFLSSGDSVVISSRDAERCAAEAARLASRYPEAAVCAFAADVGRCRLKGSAGLQKFAVISHIYSRHI